MIRAVLTGHSKGLGAGIAEALLARGVAVMGIARSGAADAKARHGDLLHEVALDLSDLGAAADWLATPELARFLKGAETALLINNSGVVSPIGPAGTQDAMETAHAVSLNVAAPIMLAQGFIAASEGIADRRILHVSSGAARSAIPGWSVYCATKAALDHHARTVAADALPGVRITSLAPGVIDTGMQAQIRSTTEDQFAMRQRFVALKEEGQLASAEACGAKLVAYMLGGRFAADPVTTLSEVA